MGGKGNEVHSDGARAGGGGGGPTNTAHGSQDQPSGSAQIQGSSSRGCMCLGAGSATGSKVGGTRGTPVANSSLECECVKDTARAANASLPTTLAMERTTLEAVQAGRARVAVVDRSADKRVPLWELNMRKGDTLEILVGKTCS